MARCVPRCGADELRGGFPGDLRAQAAARTPIGRDDRVKIAVVGAGAIGGYVGGWLAAAGEDVTFIARGANLDAIRRAGMRVIGEDGADVIGRAAAYNKTADAGPQDVVILAVKAHQVGAVAADIAALCQDETAIVTMQNGIPWWYFHKHGGAYEGTPVKSADPDGMIARL